MNLGEVPRRVTGSQVQILSARQLDVIAKLAWIRSGHSDILPQDLPALKIRCHQSLHQTLRNLTEGIDLPVNLLVLPTLSVAELGELGVRRVSSGSLPYRASVDAALDIMVALRDGTPLPTTTSYAAVQARLIAYRNGAVDGRASIT